LYDLLTGWWDRLVWQTELHSLPAWQQRPLLFLRGAQVLATDIVQGNHNLYAMGLVYKTILSLVPLLAVMFSVLKGFGVHNQLEPLLLNVLEPLGEKGVEVTTNVLAFVDNIKVGVLGAVGLGILLFTVVSLLQQIEEAFNSTWRVRNTRSLFERFSHYISVLLVGPVLIFSAVGLSQSVQHMSMFQTIIGTEAGAFLYNMLSVYLPFIMMTLAIMFIYMFVPNTRVKPMAALFGAVIATLLFKGATHLFTLFIVGSTKYTAIYSAFATLIILFIWLYITWLILLLGSSIAYYYQHAHKLRFLHNRATLTPYENEALALQVMQLVTKNYYTNRKACAIEQISEALHLPDDLVENMVYELDDGNFLKVVEDGTQILPGLPPEETTCDQVLAYVRSSGKKGMGSRIIIANPQVLDVLERAENNALDAIKDISIKQLALGNSLDLAQPRKS
jgi:membrane protein